MRIIGRCFGASVAVFILITSGGVSTYAQGNNLTARSQMRRVVDPSPRGPTGAVLMRIDPQGREIFQVIVKKFGQDNLGLFFYERPIWNTNLTPGVVLPPLDRASVRQGTWSRTLVGFGQAPPEFLPFFDHLTDLAGNSVDASQPHIPTVTTIFTNIIGGVTNISMGVTNIVGNTTNIINGIVIPNPGQTGEVFSILWAPIYEMTQSPSLLSYRKSRLLSAVGTASPNASGTVNIRFTGTTGRSLLDIRTVNLTRGQEYTLFIANTNAAPIVMIPVDIFPTGRNGSSARFVRDTQFGDPLPQQARDIGDLSGRRVEVRDAFDVVHLQGMMP